MKKTLGSVESITGGLFAAKVTSKPGASSYFKGSVIAYDNTIKEKLNIDTSRGVVNKEVALAMAKAGQDFLGVNICVSFTGNAGPKTIENDYIGKVFIAINEQVYEKQFYGSRLEIQTQCVDFAFTKLKKSYNFSL